MGMKLNNANYALIAVDIQNDFCPGGALAVKHGDRIIKPLNKLIEFFDRLEFPIIFTRDWHPPNHRSFKEYGGIWPVHCVRGTKGAEFHPLLKVPKDAIIISKATEPDSEAYSGFQGTDLAQILKRLGSNKLFIGGLATDYCVKNTVIDALNNGFEVSVIKDCIKGVNLKKTDSATAIRYMLSKGAKLISSQELLEILGKHVAILSSF